MSLLIISLLSGSPGMMAGLPDSVLARASDRNSRLNPPWRFTPPWQEIHFLLIMGLTSVLKSTAGLRVLNGIGATRTASARYRQVSRSALHATLHASSSQGR